MEGIEGEERRYRCGRDEGSEELTVRSHSLSPYHSSLRPSSPPSCQSSFVWMCDRRERREWKEREHRLVEFLPPSGRGHQLTNSSLLHRSLPNPKMNGDRETVDRKGRDKVIRWLGSTWNPLTHPSLTHIPSLGHCLAPTPTPSLARHLVNSRSPETQKDKWLEVIECGQRKEKRLMAILSIPHSDTKARPREEVRTDVGERPSFHSFPVSLPSTAEGEDEVER